MGLVNYFWHVEIRRLLSIGLIFIVLLSSTGYSKGIVPHPSFEAQHFTIQGPQLAENGQDAIQVFRETLKITVSSETRTPSFNLIENSVRLIYAVTHHAKYNSYLLSQLSQSSSQKLFLEFRSILI
jgi:hypothetical protein